MVTKQNRGFKGRGFESYQKRFRTESELQLQATIRTIRCASWSMARGGSRPELRPRSFTRGNPGRAIALQ